MEVLLVVLDPEDRPHPRPPSVLDGSVNRKVRTGVPGTGGTLLGMTLGHTRLRLRIPKEPVEEAIE
jgi:hypothetical protein